MLCLLRQLNANLEKVPQRSSGERMQNWGGRRSKQEVKLLSHIHSFCQRGTRRPSASPQVMKLLGDVLQLRLDGCQAFNLLFLTRTRRERETKERGKVEERINMAPSDVTKGYYTLQGWEGGTKAGVSVLDSQHFLFLFSAIIEFS